MIGFYLHLTIEIAHTKFLVPAELSNIMDTFQFLPSLIYL